MSRVLTGADTLFVWIWEDDGEFNQAPGDPTDSTFKVFGEEENISEPQRSNNIQQTYRPGSRGVSALFEQQFEGETGVDFIMTNTDFLEFYVPTSDNSTQTREGGRTAHIIEETATEAGNVEQTVYTGVAGTSLDIDVAVEDTVDVSTSLAYADEETFTDSANFPYGEVGTQPPVDNVAHFGHSTLDVSVGGTTTRPLVQDASISLNPSVEMQYELGTRFAVAPGFFEFEPDISYTARVNDTTYGDERSSAYGGSSAGSSPSEGLQGNEVSGSLVIDNGNFSLDISFAESLTDSYQVANLGSPEDALEDDVDRSLRDLSFTVA